MRPMGVKTPVRAPPLAYAPVRGEKCPTFGSTPMVPGKHSPSVPQVIWYCVLAERMLMTMDVDRMRTSMSSLASSRPAVDEPVRCHHHQQPDSEDTDETDDEQDTTSGRRSRMTTVTSLDDNDRPDKCVVELEMDSRRCTPHHGTCIFIVIVNSNSINQSINFYTGLSGNRHYKDY